MNLSDEMLTTPNAQYLHPDYLQPLPTTLDAKKSPLALLAQTCSSIGKDPSPNSKPIIPPFGKKEPEKAQEKSQTPENKRSGSSNSKTEVQQTRDLTGIQNCAVKRPTSLGTSEFPGKAEIPSNACEKVGRTGESVCF